MELKTFHERLNFFIEKAYNILRICIGIYLFVACSVFVFVNVWDSFITNQDDSPNAILTNPNTYFFGRYGYYMTFALLLNLVACYGFVRDHRKCLQAFAGLTLITTCMMGWIMVSSTDPYDSWPASAINEVKRSMNDYIWHGNFHEAQNSVTRNWDLVQEVNECCGFFGPKDWKSLRRSDWLQGYPISCCSKLDNQSSGFCDPHLYGCAEILEEKSNKRLGFTMVFQLIFAAFAYIFSLVK